MQQTRRAAPPRPSLLVGDLEGCHRAFERLQEAALRLQLQESATVSEEEGAPSPVAAAWGELVPRCRAIRETLTSVHELSDFTRQVYEASADICVRAGDLGEALKCLRQLVERIYASLAVAAGAAQQDAGAGSGPPPPPGLARAAGAAEDLQQQQGQQQRGQQQGQQGQQLVASEGGDLALARWPEMAAALLLFYVSQQAGAEGLDAAITLRRLPAALVRSAEVQRALRLVVAQAAGDYVRFFRLLGGAPRLVQLVVAARLPQVRQGALVSMAAAYRNIETAAVARMLGLDGPAAGRAVLAVLKQLADRGHRAAQVALDNAQTGNEACPADLVFR